MWRRRNANRWKGAVVATVAFALSACVGATERADFENEIRARGGGLAIDWTVTAFDVVAAELGVDDAADIEVLTLTIEPVAQAVTVQARRGDRPDFVDVIIVRDGRLFASTPTQDADELPLDDLATPLGELPFDDVEVLADTALAEFGEPDAFVARIEMSILVGERVIDVLVESGRRTATIRFDETGELIGEQS